MKVFFINIRLKKLVCLNRKFFYADSSPPDAVVDHEESLSSAVGFASREL